jgi:acetolactate synthase-1/2/3 large subunit
MAAEESAERMNGAQAVMRGLRDAGARYVFGYPGGTAMDLFEALGQTDGLEFVLVRHEQSAVHAADGYARSTGKPGVALVTSGPGATNTVTGIATAYMDSVPVIVLCAQVGTNFIGTDAFQEVDSTGITLPVVKHSYLVKDAQELPRIIAEAFYIASTGRPGPVLIDLPADMQQAMVTYRLPDKIELDSYRPSYKGNHRQIKQAANLIMSSSRPVLYAGGGIIASGATDELIQLAELMDIPTVVTLAGKSCFPAHHRLNLGLPGMHGSVLANHVLAASDLVITVGARFAQRVTGSTETFATGAKVIHIDIDPAEIGKNVETQVPIVGDAKIVLTSLIEMLEKKHAEPVDQEWVSQVKEWRKTEDFQITDYPGSIAPERFMDELDARIADLDAYVITDVGQHQLWAAQRLDIDEPRHFISSCGLGTMGFGLPAAMGVQLAHPSARVILVSGDGSFQMNVQEMATIGVNNLPILAIVINNRCLGMVLQQAKVKGYHVRFSTDLPDDGTLPDFVKLADVYGWRGARITKPEEVAGALDEALAADEPYLLEVDITDEANVWPMMYNGTSICALPERNAAEDAEDGEGE